eukprot:snap_masked-scaffold_4-processed-gene-10.4-mRNA-1 protein AED:1.00 eAED:1.00 QI:0/-1/0/0/-1/1/1/0/72
MINDGVEPRNPFLATQYVSEPDLNRRVEYRKSTSKGSRIVCKQKHCFDLPGCGSPPNEDVSQFIELAAGSIL